MENREKGSRLGGAQTISRELSGVAPRGIRHSHFWGRISIGRQRLWNSAKKKRWSIRYK